MHHQLVLLFMLLGQCYGANILAVLPLPAHSHFLFSKRLLIGLAEKGHNVDVVSAFPLSTPVKGLTVNRYHAWLDALGIDQRIKKYSYFSRICSIHFNTSDIIITPRGKMTLRHGALPALNLGPNVEHRRHFLLQRRTQPELYTDLSIKESVQFRNFSVDEITDKTLTKSLVSVLKVRGVEICKNSFKTENMKKLKNTTKKYDLVITELFSSDCMLGWASYFGAPSVLMTTSVGLPWGSNRFGLPDNPSYIPSYFVEYGSNMTFYQRVVNTWTLVFGNILYYLYSEKPSNTLAKQFFGEDIPDLQILTNNQSLLLVNSHFSINSARPLVPNVIEVAGLHIEDPKPVNEYFSRLLETDSKGIIYFSLGSLIASETFSVELLEFIFGAFAELPYNIIWKAEKEKFPKNLKYPNNIRFEPWMPQLDILCDSRLKLFISHGGMMGLQEAVYCGKPILGIPGHADQRHNLKHAELMGFAEIIEFKSITKDRLLTILKKILNDPKYAENAKITSEQFKDRPLSPLDTAIYWTEYVMKHKGAPRIQSYAKRLSWYQYYLLDVIAVIVGIPCILLCSLIVLIMTRKAKNDIKKKMKIKIKST